MLTDQQKLERMDAIYASDVSKLTLSESDYAEVILQKAGIVKPHDISKRPYVTAGNIFEKTILNWASEQLGMILTPTETFQCPKLDCLKGHVDGLLFDKKEGVEIKLVGVNQSRKYGRPGTSEVPYNVYMQCHAYLTILDYDIWHIAAMINSTTLSLFKIKKCKETSKFILDLSAKAWRDVDKCKKDPNVFIDMLDLNYEQGQRALKDIYDKSPSGAIELSKNSERRVIRINEINKEMSLLDEEKKIHKAILAKEMRGYEIGKLKSGKVIKRMKINVKARDGYSYIRTNIPTIEPQEARGNLESNSEQ